MGETRVHFDGLNALRFIAASLVVVGHTSRVLDFFGVGSSPAWLNPETGKLAVMLFFVLSGFLITYLLLVERASAGEISIHNFYLRRMLRIWPLYYLLVFTAFLLLPKISFLEVPSWSIAQYHWWPNFLLYATIFPNLASPIPYVSHLWSIGVEEQFYLVWPIVMKYVRGLTALLIAIVIVYPATLWLVTFVPAAARGRVLVRLFEALFLFRVDCLVLGALAALALFHRVRAVLAVVYSRAAQIVVLAALGFLYVCWVDLQFLTYEVYGLLFAVLILNVCSNPRSLVKLNQPVFESLGRVSYGIYMYHPLAVVLTVKLMVLCTPGVVRASFFRVVAHLLAMVVTIGFSYASYYWFEWRFLRLKLKVSSIVSGDLVSAKDAA